MDSAKIAELHLSEQSYRGAIELFQMRNRSMNLSINTILWYGMILEMFIVFLHTLPDRPTPRHTKSHHVRAFLDHLYSKITKTGKRVAPGSVKRFYICLKTFYRFLEQERVCLANPMVNIEMPKAPRVVIRPLSVEQIGALLTQFDTKRYAGLRDWVMTLLALDSGLRLSEMLGIRTQDIDWAENGINVMGKGAKERVVHFGAKVKRALWDYKQRRGDIQGCDHFFVDQFSRPIKKRWYQQILARAGKAAEIIGVRVSPHTLRHSFAVQYIMNGGDAASLRLLLGHSTMETVTIYTNLANKDTAKLHRRYSPLDNLETIPGAIKRVHLR